MRCCVCDVFTPCERAREDLARTKKKTLRQTREICFLLVNECCVLTARWRAHVRRRRQTKKQEVCKKHIYLARRGAEPARPAPRPRAGRKHRRRAISLFPAQHHGWAEAEKKNDAEYHVTMKKNRQKSWHEKR